MISDYAEHSVALQHLVSQLQAALRDKRLRDADRIAADAMARLHRIHGCIHRLEQDAKP